MKKKKKKSTPEEIEQRSQRKDVRAIFRYAGFKKVMSVSDKQFEFCSEEDEEKGEKRKGDLDDIFIYENIIVFVEYTTTKAQSLSSHLFKKKVLFDLLLADKQLTIEFFEKEFSDFKKTRKSKFSASQCQLVVLYCSKNKVSADNKKNCPRVKFLDYPILRYFLGISKIIKKSSRFELLNFLGINSQNVGELILSGNKEFSELYNGHVLPEEHSDFGKGFKVVSFYIDPESLIKRSYVFRREGWRDSDNLYQRMLIQSKIRKMREYLTNKRRVFINNIIVSLRSDKIELLDDNGDPIKPSNLSETQPIRIRIKEGVNSIGLIDGQHRVLCYHEGDDEYDTKISSLRTRQNLLITGIIYPKDIEESKRLEFEARLFLEINANQNRADSELKQSIELVLNPFSPIAISKALIFKLGEHGPLEDILKQYFYDKKKIPTSSIVSYGLIPLLKLSGEDSLFSIWRARDKNKLVKRNNKKLLDSYKEFCSVEINNLLNGFQANIPDKFWTSDKTKSRFLTSTSINGLLTCLRFIIKNNKRFNVEQYILKFNGVDKFPFSSYKSSQWTKLGEDLYNKFFT